MSSSCPRVNIRLCAPPEKLVKARGENMRTASELEQVAPSQLPSTGYPESRRGGSDAAFRLVC